jgi:glycerol kinase
MWVMSKASFASGELELAIGQGMSATKTVAVDRQGKVVAYISVPLKPLDPVFGWQDTRGAALQRGTHPAAGHHPREWDPWLLDLFGIPRAALPRLVSRPVHGQRRPGSAPARGTVTGVLGDSHAALFAHAGWHPGHRV